MRFIENKRLFNRYIPIKIKEMEGVRLLEGSLAWILTISAIIALCIAMIIVRFRRRRRYDLAKITLKDIDQMTGYEFEDYLYVLFSALEYEQTFLTKKSGDYGADLLLLNDIGEKIVVQVKRLTDKLGLTAVQEVYAAQAYYDADRALIVTSTADISGPCRKLAAATKVRIVDRDELNEIIHSFKRGRYVDARAFIEEPFEPVFYNPSASLEVLEQERGLIQAGEFFYKT